MTFTDRTLLPPTAAGGLLTAALLATGCTDADPVGPEAAKEPLVAAAGAVARAQGQGSALQTADIFGQAAAGEREVVYAEGGAILRRTSSGISIQVRMPTPEPGTYEYPAGAEMGHPEAFTLWIFADGVPFLGAGHVVGGRQLTLSGHIAKTTVPFTGGEPLGEAVATADVRITIAPHGRVDPDKLPEQIQTPSGSDPFWWVAQFD